VNTVSVIVPCYNAGDYLDECVASIGRQSPGPFTLLEAIVVDDGSTDGATRRALELVSRHSAVRVIENEGRKGSAGARNTGVRHARGDWIAFLDADDWWSDDSLLRRFLALEDFPGARWVGGDFCDAETSSPSSRIGRFEQRLTNYPFLAPAYVPIRRALVLANPLPLFLVAAPTHTIVTMVRRDVLNAHGGFAEHLLRAQDFHLWLRLAADVPFLFVPQVLAYYRHHGANSTRSASHTLQWRSIALRDLLKNDRMREVRRELTQHLASASLALSYEHRKERNTWPAVLSSLRAIECQPSSLPAWKSLFASALGRS
jgi:glycosyltransferase involved in cell wall biosynthesis